MLGPIPEPLCHTVPLNTQSTALHIPDTVQPAGGHLESGGQSRNPIQGWLPGRVACAVTQGPVLRRPPGLVSCFTIPGLRFVVILLVNV